MYEKVNILKLVQETKKLLQTMFRIFRLEISGGWMDGNLFNDFQTNSCADGSL